MPKALSKTSAKPREETHQEAQERLVKEAVKHPGVAETMEVYGRLARYGGTVGRESLAIKHATGGNLSRS